MAFRLPRRHPRHWGWVNQRLVNVEGGLLYVFQLQLVVLAHPMLHSCLVVVECFLRFIERLFNSQLESNVSEFDLYCRCRVHLHLPPSA